MRSFVVLLVAGAFGLSCSAISKAEEVDPGDLTEFFLGKWTVKGEADTFKEECRLLTKNSFILCEGEIADPNEPYQWLSMRGYSHFENLYNYSEFGGDGSEYRFKGWRTPEGIWTFVAHREYENRIVRIEDVLRPTESGYTAKRRISIDGGDWETRFEEERIRLPE